MKFKRKKTFIKLHNNSNYFSSSNQFQSTQERFKQKISISLQTLKLQKQLTPIGDSANGIWRHYTVLNSVHLLFSVLLLSFTTIFLKPQTTFLWDNKVSHKKSHSMTILARSLNKWESETESERERASEWRKRDCENRYFAREVYGNWTLCGIVRYEQKKK